MAYLLVHQNVEGYAKWKSVYDEHSAMRGAAGSKGGQVLQSADDPNEVIAESLIKLNHAVGGPPGMRMPSSMNGAMDALGVGASLSNWPATLNRDTRPRPRSRTHTDPSSAQRASDGCRNSPGPAPSLPNMERSDRS